MQSRRQIPYLHILRIIAILMVLMLHSITPYVSDSKIYGSTSWFIYLFLNAVSRGGVPLFFMISGYLLLSDSRSGNFKEFYSRRLSRILIPLLIWNVLYYVFYCIFNSHIPSVSEFVSQSLNTGTAYHLWYIYTLFGIYLTIPFLKKIVDSCTLKQLSVLLVIICFCPTIRPLFNVVTPMYIYFFDPLFNGYMGYFLLGYILANKEFTNRQTVAAVVFGILAIILCMIGANIPQSEIAQINFNVNSGYSICFYAISTAFFLVFKRVEIKSEKIIKILKHLSKATFGIYLVHVAVMEAVTRYFMIDASPIVSTMYLFAVSLPVSYLFSVIVGKIKYLT